MAQIVLAHENQNLRNLLEINLKTFLRLNVVLRENALEIIKLLKFMPEISLIIASTRLGEEKTAEILFNHVKKK